MTLTALVMISIWSRICLLRSVIGLLPSEHRGVTEDRSQVVVRGVTVDVFEQMLHEVILTVLPKIIPAFLIIVVSVHGGAQCEAGGNRLKGFEWNQVVPGFEF